jgi:hypothetical protein
MNDLVKRWFLSYKFFLWFMRIVAPPIAYLATYTLFQTAFKIIHSPAPINNDDLLYCLIMLVGSPIAIDYAVIAWCVGWRKDKNKEVGK